MKEDEEENEGYLARVEAKGEAGPHGLHTIYSRPVTMTCLPCCTNGVADSLMPIRGSNSGGIIFLKAALSLSLSVCAPTPISLADGRPPRDSPRLLFSSTNLVRTSRLDRRLHSRVTH